MHTQSNYIQATNSGGVLALHGVASATGGMDQDNKVAVYVQLVHRMGEENQFKMIPNYNNNKMPMHLELNVGGEGGASRVAKSSFMKLQGSRCAEMHQSNS